MTNNELYKLLKRAVSLAEAQQERLKKCETVIENFFELLNAGSTETEMYIELLEEIEMNNKDLSINGKYKEYYENYRIKEQVKIQYECYKTIFKLCDELSQPRSESHE